MAKANTGGRPRMLDDAMCQTLCHLRRETLASLSAAARHVGLHPGTVSGWLRRGEAEHDRLAELAETDPDTSHDPDETEAPFLRFFTEWHRATDEFARDRITRIKKLADDDGKDSFAASKFLLAKADPEWGDAPKRTELTGAGGGPVQVEGAVDAATILALAAELTGGYDETEDTE